MAVNDGTTSNIGQSRHNDNNTSNDCEKLLDTSPGTRPQTQSFKRLHRNKKHRVTACCELKSQLEFLPHSRPSTLTNPPLVGYLEFTPSLPQTSLPFWDDASVSPAALQPARPHPPRYIRPSPLPLPLLSTPLLPFPLHLPPHLPFPPHLTTTSLLVPAHAHPDFPFQANFISLGLLEVTFKFTQQKESR